MTAAEPWMTWMSRISLNGVSSAPNATAPPTMPTSSIMHSRPTTFGWLSTGARSVASASPTVCTVCTPAPTRRNAKAAATVPTQAGALLSPERRISANGMMASPPNCTSEPIQR